MTRNGIDIALDVNFIKCTNCLKWEMTSILWKTRNDNKGINIRKKKNIQMIKISNSLKIVRICTKFRQIQLSKWWQILHGENLTDFGMRNLDDSFVITKNSWFRLTTDPRRTLIWKNLRPANCAPMPKKLTITAAEFWWFDETSCRLVRHALYVFKIGIISGVKYRDANFSRIRHFQVWSWFWFHLMDGNVELI